MSQDGDSAVYTAAPGVDKDKLGSTPVSYPPVETDGIDTVSGCLDPAASLQITPPGGSTNYIRVNGRSKIITNYVPFAYVGGVRFTENNSTVRWDGVSPFNANNVSHTDRWDIDFTAVSYSIGSSPSGSVSVGGGALEWTTNSPNNWISNHVDGDIRFGLSGPGTILDAEYNVSGTFQFGSSSFRQTGYSHQALNARGTPWGGC